MRRRLAHLLLLAVLVGAGCSLPTDDEAAVIDPDTLPDALRSDGTTTTTTVDPGPRTEPIEIFLLRTDADRSIVQQVGREVDRVAPFEQTIGLLFGPEIRTEEEQELGWSNTLREFQLLEAFVNENQVAIIDMVAVDENGDPIDVEAQVLQDAAAQLVYTATGLPREDPILAVRIRIDGAAEFIPTVGGDTKEVVNRSDFEDYDVDWVAPTTTAPPTTEPPADPDPDA